MAGGRSADNDWWLGRACLLVQSCKVAIDVLEGKKAARVTGGRQACEAARSKLEEITLSITEDLPLTENL